MKREKKDRVRIFCPYARSLSQEELSSIPADLRQRAEAGDEGVWLEVRCPQEKCLVGDHEVKIEIRGIEDSEREGLWHKVFCPEEICLAESATDLP